MKHFTTYRFNYRRPQVEPGSQNQEDFFTESVDVDLCIPHRKTIGPYLGSMAVSSDHAAWTGKAAVQCDMCEAKGHDRGLIAILMDRVFRLDVLAPGERFSRTYHVVPCDSFGQEFPTRIVRDRREARSR